MLTVPGKSRPEARSNDVVLTQSQVQRGPAHPLVGKVGWMPTHTQGVDILVSAGAGTGTGCVSAAKTLISRRGSLGKTSTLCFCTSKTLVQWARLPGKCLLQLHLSRKCHSFLKLQQMNWSEHSTRANLGTIKVWMHRAFPMPRGLKGCCGGQCSRGEG